MELLAPAGNKDALLAALDNGADAVYLGYTAFGARAGAGNFDEAGLEEAVRLCHLRHVRVYATVNTLVKEGELPAVLSVLALLNRAGVDAVLLQDLGAAALARDCFPGLIRHASTQMSIHNAQGAEFLKREGFRRVVLARECSLEEIRAAADTGLEVEVFIHGALCVCVSGQCLFSSLAGGRSGNRGRCAQPCRMAYEFGGAKGYWLSPRDLMLRDRLPELKAAGVSALKIEGRLKRPEYVALVTRAYRRALDSLEEGRFAPADEAEKECLRQIFNRGGFMPGYAGNSQDAGAIDSSRPGHAGIILGQVTGLRPGFAQVALSKGLHDGDGLQFRGTMEGETTYSGPSLAAGETALIRLREGLAPQKGDQVVRLTDALQMKDAMAVQAPPIPADMTLQAEPGTPALLTATDGEVSVCVQGEMVAQAQAKPLTMDGARRALEKTGDTAFVLRDLVLFSQGGFLPVSSLNALRREALEQLAKARAQAFGTRDFTQLSLPSLVPSKKPAAPRLLVQSRDAVLGDKLLAAGAEVFLYAPEDYAPEALEGACRKLPKESWLVLPVQARRDTLEKLREFAQGRFAGVVLGSIGQAGIGIPMAGGEGIPVFNSRTAAELDRLGLTWLTVSPELNAGEIQTLPLMDFPFVLTVYGRARLMALNHCPARTALGLDRDHETCRLCDTDSSRSLKGINNLKDGAGREFPLLRTHLPEGCLVNVYNTLPLSLADKAKSLQNLGWQLTFTTESPQEQLEITACFAALREGRPSAMPLPRGTAGHYSRGVE